MNNDIKGFGNSYTAEYWEYDPRIGRRWNVDPVFKEYESPYAAFGNNPLLNIDPDGADTAKYLSNSQLVGALKIASAEIKRRIDLNKGFEIGKESSIKNLGSAISTYAQANDLSNNQLQEFHTAVQQYYNGLATVAMISESNFNTLNRSVINSNGLTNYQIVNLSVGLMREAEADLNLVMHQAKNAAYFAASGGVGSRVGSSPRGPQINSNTQRAIVESQAGLRFTDVTIKRFIDPSRTVSASDLRRAIGTRPYADPQSASGANAYYTTILKNGKNYNLKVVYHPQSNTIYHFHYSRQAMGPLIKIQK